MTTFIRTFDSTPVIGERISGRTITRGRTVATWSGIYDGTRQSEWDGGLCHFLRDGEINGIPQGIFGHPVNADELRAANLAYMLANPAIYGPSNG